MPYWFRYFDILPLRLWLVILLFVLFAWVGRVAFGRWQRAGLVAASYNIRYDNPGDGIHQWSLRKERLVRELMAQQPGVIGMQEVLHSQLQALRQLMPARYQWVGVGRDDGGEAGEYAPIGYDHLQFKLLQQGVFWLSETPERPSKGWDAALPRICTWVQLESVRGKRRFWVFNAHLDHQGVQARAESVSLMMAMADRVSQSDPVLLMGDFNDSPEALSIRALSKAGWLDAHTQAEKKGGSEGSFYGFEGDRSGARIDYIWYRNLPAPRWYEIDGPPGRRPPFASDHCPVYAHFAF
jgi:endonuclease/exonuclease/phosphatase family metal-dependent hydrolase